MFKVRRLDGEVSVDDQHQYWIDGDGPYPSVTHLIGTGRSYYKPEHAARGTRAHLACEVYDRIGECLTEVDEGGYLEAWQAFQSDMGDRFHIIDIEVGFVAEVEMPEGTFRYGGRVDRICKVDGSLAVLDIKSGSKNAWHQTQLAAYAMPFFTITGYAVYIAKTGRYKVEQHNDLRDVFMSWAGGIQC